MRTKIYSRSPNIELPNIYPPILKHVRSTLDNDNRHLLASNNSIYFTDYKAEKLDWTRYNNTREFTLRVSHYIIPFNGYVYQDELTFPGRYYVLASYDITRGIPGNRDYTFHIWLPLVPNTLDLLYKPLVRINHIGKYQIPRYVITKLELTLFA